MKMFFISLIAKTVALISRFFNLGAGVTWPGEIALRIDNQLIQKLTPQVRKGIIIVAGTNGKTTTSAQISHILTKKGFSVIHNATGANLENGIIGTFLLNSNIFGKLDCDYAIFELDEAAFPKIVPKLKPKLIVLLNLFRDQLDRYGEVDSIAQKWISGLSEVNSTLITNADDPLIAEIGKKYKGKVLYFGLNNKKLTLSKLSHATDSTYCLNCGAKFTYKSVYLSHFGDWYCANCKIKRPKLDLENVSSPLPGVYNLYNSMAAVLTSLSLGINKDFAQNSLLSFKAAFGRQEEFTINNKKIKIFLSKNPAGFNESIRTVLSQKNYATIIFALNDRIADGTDVSWIWDVDFEQIVSASKLVICTGDRFFDMALRIKYAIQNSKFKIQNNIKEAISLGLKNTKTNQTLYILPTYTAMLDIRKILTGKKIL